MARYVGARWKNGLIIAIVLLVLGFGVAYIRLKAAQPFSIIHRLIAPFQRLTTNIWNWGQNTASYFKNYRHFLEDKKNLEAENNQLELVAAENMKLQQENVRLRSLLNFPALREHEYLGAKVIGFTGSNWQKGLIINRGSADGLKVKMPVITYNGYLVGQIRETYAHTAHVILVTDPSFVVGGLIQREGARDLGVVRGQLWAEGFYVMDNLAWNAQVEIGDTVVTSGLSDIFPKDIPIGKILKVNTGDFGLTQEAILRFFVSDVTIEEVLVIMEQGG